MSHDQNDWVRPSQTQASLRDHIKRLSSRHDILTVDAPTGSFEISRQKQEFTVVHYGTGGGWCWKETGWSLDRVVSYLSQWNDDSTYDEIQLQFTSACDNR